MTSDKIILVDEHLTINEKSQNFNSTSQGRKFRSTRPNIIKMLDQSNDFVLTYIHI